MGHGCIYIYIHNNIYIYILIYSYVYIYILKSAPNLFSCRGPVHHHHQGNPQAPGRKCERNEIEKGGFNQPMNGILGMYNKAGWWFEPL